MKKFSACLACFLLAPWLGVAAEPQVLPPFKELFSLIESNLAGVLAAELDQAAARGLIEQLDGRVIVVSGDPAPTNAPGGLTRTNVYDSAYGYLRFGRIDDSVAEQFKGGWQTLRASNELKGLVIDLRFARGTNYAAAMAVADMFLAKEGPLLHVEDTVHQSTAKSDAIRLPVAVLVNRRTAGAAEALAAVLRHHNAGLVIGARTAGQAMIYREFPLSTGQRLRMATKYIRVADGPLLPSKGLKPDIEVEVSESDEKRYFEDAFAVLGGPGDTASGTNRLFSRAINEAELVRRHREGQNPDAEAAEPAPAPKPAEPQVRDPVLGRALDLLKGLAVVKKLQ